MQQHRKQTSHSVAHVLRQQRGNGSFPVVCSTTRRSRLSRAADITVHAYILDLLCAHITDNTVHQCGVRLAQYIVRNLQHNNVSLDTTIDTHALFVALAALHHFDSTYVTPQMVAATVGFLLTHEAHPGGPYRSSTDTDNTRQYDLATNIAICRLLHYVGGPFPKLTAYIARHYQPSMTGRYYTATWPLQWQLSGTVFPDTTKLAAIQSSLEIQRAATMTTTLRGTSLVFCDPQTDVRYGSPALDKLRILHPTQHHATRQSARTHTVNTFALARRSIRTLDPLLRHDIQGTLRRLRRADHQHEISALAWQTAPAIQHHELVDAQTLHALDMANLFNWAAYTMYDDIIDTEDNASALLPAANVCLRMAIKTFHSAVPEQRFYDIVRQTYTTIDTANAWELHYCRAIVQANTIQLPPVLPEYGDLHNLHDRSLSHSLPFLGTLLSAGFALDSTATQTAWSAFRHYLVIRQLNDDLHDWQADLQVGHLSYVVVCLLRDADTVTGSHTLDGLTNHLKQVFWRATLPQITTTMQTHAKRAQWLLQQSTVVTTDTNFVSNLITGILDMTVRLQRELAQAAAVLAQLSS